MKIFSFCQHQPGLLSSPTQRLSSVGPPLQGSTGTPGPRAGTADVVLVLPRVRINYLQGGARSKLLFCALLYAVRRTTISISEDMVKHHIQIQGARHVAQLNTVASKDKGGKMFAPQTFLPGTKNVSTFGRNEYVGKQGTADRVDR